MRNASFSTYNSLPFTGTSTKRLNEQVRRNSARFPIDFMFRHTAKETSSLNWSQIATSSQKHRRTIFAPYAFTEHGAIMAANVLNTSQAIKMSVYVVRAFVQLRELMLSNKELALRLDLLEARLEKRLVTHDEAIAAMLSAIRELMLQPARGNRALASPPTFAKRNRREVHAASRLVATSTHTQHKNPWRFNSLCG